METIKIVNYILLGTMFVLAYSANLSTRQNKRQWLYVGFAITAISYLIFSGIYSSYQDNASESWIISYNLFCGIGFVLPQLVSRIIVRQNINHPVVFMQKNKIPVVAIAIMVLVLLYLLLVALIPHTYYVKDHTPAFDEFYVISSLSFLLFYIPFVILILEFTTQRNAFCENGLYQNGLISEWTDFKSYRWIYDKIYDDPEASPFLDKNTKIILLIEPVKTLFKKPIQIFIPFDEKGTIEELLSQRIKVCS
jgi:hypothetical protein